MHAVPWSVHFNECDSNQQEKHLRAPPKYPLMIFIFTYVLNTPEQLTRNVKFCLPHFIERALLNNAYQIIFCLSPVE